MLNSDNVLSLSRSLQVWWFESEDHQQGPSARESAPSHRCCALQQDDPPQVPKESLFKLAGLARDRIRRFVYPCFDLSIHSETRSPDPCQHGLDQKPKSSPPSFTVMKCEDLLSVLGAWFSMCLLLKPSNSERRPCFHWWTQTANPLLENSIQFNKKDHSSRCRCDVLNLLTPGHIRTIELASLSIFHPKNKDRPCLDSSSSTELSVLKQDP